MGRTVPDDGLGTADRNDADVVMVVVTCQAARFRAGGWQVDLLVADADLGSTGTDA